MKNRFKLLHIILLALFLFLSSPPSLLFSSYPARVTDISNRDYYPAVKEAIENARESIYMAIYLISLTPGAGSPVRDLCRSLADAHKRGVKVRVILDKNVNFRTGELELRSREAYRYLRDAGVDVSYDDRYIYTHNKALVIDREIVIAGSANWSQAALTQSNETSLLIRSAPLAESILERFSGIRPPGRGRKRVFDRGEALALNTDFMGPHLGGEMISSSDERAFDLYLLLLREKDEAGVIELDFGEFAEGLGIADMNPSAYRRQIIKTLRKLDDRYGLLETEFHHGRNALVTLTGSGVGDTFLIPASYFEYGWNRRLSLSAKYCYLINRYMADAGGSFTWSLQREALAEKFHLSPHTVSSGMIELRRFNIIDISYSPVADGDYEGRSPSVYEILGLYCLQEHSGELSRLAREYGSGSLDEALRFASAVFKENDIRALEEIILLFADYGKAKMNKAYEIISEMAVDNPLRSFRYAVGTVKGLRYRDVE